MAAPNVPQSTAALLQVKKPRSAGAAGWLGRGCRGASLRRCVAALLAGQPPVEVTSILSVTPHLSPKMFASAVRRNALKGLIPPKIATPSAIVRVAFRKPQDRPRKEVVLC